MTYENKQRFINEMNYSNTTLPHPSSIDSFQKFMDKISLTFDKCFPITKKPLRKNESPWITKGIKKSCRKKASAYNPKKPV